MNSISVFFPLRAGSSRIKRKNTRAFHPDGRSLFLHKLDQIRLISHLVQEIVISTNDEEIIEQFPRDLTESNIRIERRPDALGRSDTKVRDLIDYVPTVTRGQWIFWLHATSPFVDEYDYKAALDMLDRSVASGEHDSIMSVNKVQQFLWDDQLKRVVNTDRSINPWPNTQDLQPVYEINHAFYINSRKNYLNLHDRIGVSPALFICEGMKKIDIDWQDDFNLAQALLPAYELGRP